MSEILLEWFEIAKYIGAGATFVLGIAVWKLWKAYQAEVSYSKSRDKETLHVLSALTSMLKDAQAQDTLKDERLMSTIKSLGTDYMTEIKGAIHDLRNTIERHIL